MKNLALELKERYKNVDDDVLVICENWFKYDKLINNPEINDFGKGVVLESAFQQEKWSEEALNKYTHADWLSVVNYLSAKALFCIESGKVKKGKHHLITTAAVLSHWHARLTEGTISDEVYPNDLISRVEFLKTVSDSYGK